MRTLKSFLIFFLAVSCGDNASLVQEEISSLPKIDYLDELFEPSDERFIVANGNCSRARAGKGLNHQEIGNGTSQDPFLIVNGFQLYTLAFTKEDYGKKFKLCDDINLKEAYENGLTYFTIGSGLETNLAFSGVFDGNGKKISNFVFDVTDGGIEKPRTSPVKFRDGSIKRNDQSQIGLFSVLRNGTVQNLTLENFSLTLESSEADQEIGSLCGFSSDSNIVDVSLTGNTQITVQGSTKSNIAGLVGRSYNTSFDRVNVSIEEIDAEDSENVGGMVGSLEGSQAVFKNAVLTANAIKAGSFIGGAFGKISDSARVENVSSKVDLIEAKYLPSRALGGFVGFLDGQSVIFRSSADSVIRGNSNFSSFAVGGFVGELKGSTVSRSVSLSQISLPNGTEDNRAGGFLGVMQGGSVTLCAANGSVSSTRAGGFVSKIDQNSPSSFGAAEIKNSYSAVDVTGVRMSTPAGNIIASGEVGGFFASLSTGFGNDIFIENCYSSGNVSADTTNASGAGSRYVVGGFGAIVSLFGTSNITINESFSSGQRVRGNIDDNDLVIDEFIGSLNRSGSNVIYRSGRLYFLLGQQCGPVEKCRDQNSDGPQPQTRFYYPNISGLGYSWPTVLDGEPVWSFPGGQNPILLETGFIQF